MENLEKLAEEYQETIKGIHLLNMQRLGLSADLCEETIKLRAKFFIDGRKYHKPLVNNPNSPYYIKGKEVNISKKV